MNKHEQIREHLRVIHKTTTPDTIRYLHTIVATVQEDLDAIEALLHPETETLASSVLRLTEKLNAAEKHAKSLHADLGVATRSNAYLREELSRRSQVLGESWDKIKVLEEEVVKQTRYTEARKEHIKNLTADLDATLKDNTYLNEYTEILKKDRREMLRQGYSVVGQDNSQDLAVANRTIATLQVKVDRKDACLRRVLDNLARIRDYLVDCK